MKKKLKILELFSLYAVTSINSWTLLYTTKELENFGGLLMENLLLPEAYG